MIPLNVVCEAALLSAALRAVAPHVAKKDEDMPALAGVALTVSGGELVVAASDRATMATYRLPAEGEGAAVWSAASAKAAMSWAKGQEDYLAVRDTTLVAGQAELEVELLEDPFPDVVGVVRRWQSFTPQAPGLSVIEVDPGLLGRFSRTDLSQHVTDKGHSLTLRATGHSSPIVVTYGDRFTGLLAAA